MIVMKKMGLLVFCLSLLFTGFIFNPTSSSAACATIYKDNDQTGTGYSGTWSKISSSSLINGSARIHYDSSNVEYYWNVTNSCANAYWSFQVYLNHAQFTNTWARYYKDNSPTYSINQNTAYPGWNTIETVYMADNTSYKYSVSAVAFNADDNTGADQIRFVD